MEDIDLLRVTLEKSACGLGIEMSSGQEKEFLRFSQLLLDYNKIVNVTAIKDPEGIAVKHFADSLTLLRYAPPEKDTKFIDVGCGAGFPGVPVGIMRPDIKISFLDSVGKKLKFIEHVLPELKINGAVLHMRAEDAGNKIEMREKFDYAVARAVAPLPVLAEYCLPLVRIGGIFTAMKGVSVRDEINAAENALKTVGGKIEDIYEFTIPGTDFKRTIIKIRKETATPKKYPRKPAIIKAKPL